MVEDGKIYCKKSSLDSNTDGVYMGTDGISLGTGNKLKLTSDGTFYAEKGYIGGTDGFTLDKNKLYNGKSSISDMSDGIYLGTDGIALGANNIFKVTSQGVLTAKSGEIGGAVLDSNSIRASNNMWWIHADGSSSFEHVYINGVQNGSQFGSVIYSNSITSGTFGGVSSFGSNHYCTV